MEEHDLRRVTFCHTVDLDAPSIMQPSVVQAHESHSGKKISALPAENNSPFFLSQTGSNDHCVRGKLNLFFSFLHERGNDGCLALFLSSLQTVVFAFLCLCCKAINSTSSRDSGHQKEETTGTDTAETISVTSMHRCAHLSSFSSKKLNREARCVCSIAQMGTILNVFKRLLIMQNQTIVSGLGRSI